MYERPMVTTRLGAVLLDLDRCEHGRHSVDPCPGCPDGYSTGNLLIPPGTVIGHGADGAPIVVPHPGKRHDHKAWRGQG